VKKISHTGSWQGFKTAISRYPTLDLTVITLANLAETPIGTINAAIAGIVEPSLAEPHLLGAAPLAQQPPTALPALLARVAAGDPAAPVTPSLRRFMTSRERATLRRELAAAPSWKTLGCDRLAEPSVDGVGAGSAYSCYAIADTGKAGRVITVLYTSDWKASWIDMYTY
jgi:hypothetical protein